VEVSHTDLSEVTRMVLVHVDLVVVLTTGKTTTTGMLAVLADTSVTCGNVTAAIKGECVSYCPSCSDSSSDCVVLFVHAESHHVHVRPPRKLLNPSSVATFNSSVISSSYYRSAQVFCHFFYVLLFRLFSCGFDSVCSRFVGDRYNVLLAGLAQVGRHVVGM